MRHHEFRHSHHPPFDDPGRLRPHHHGPRGGGRGRGRAPRGDVRTAVLLLLAEQSMHGYQLMQAIADRTGGAWTPSPGAIYPTINQLEDEGLVTVTAESGRRLVTLTDAGREHVAEHAETRQDPFAAYDAGAPGADLRRLVHEVVDAVRQVGRAGTDTQREVAAKILADTRRTLYLLLADAPDPTTDEGLNA